MLMGWLLLAFGGCFGGPRGRAAEAGASRGHRRDTAPRRGTPEKQGCLRTSKQRPHTEINTAQSLNLAEFINHNLGSVHINEAQNNPFQLDVRFRGFTASPLLGLPQGLATYQDGIRINEPFGDTVNWDVIPQSAIASINLIPGSNPLFGLNTLGGCPLAEDSRPALHIPVTT